MNNLQEFGVSKLSIEEQYNTEGGYVKELIEFAACFADGFMNGLG